MIFFKKSLDLGKRVVFLHSLFERVLNLLQSQFFVNVKIQLFYFKYQAGIAQLARARDL